jgi:hypothetical protein
MFVEVVNIGLQLSLFFHLLSCLCFLRCVDIQETSGQDSENFHFMLSNFALFPYRLVFFQALSIPPIVSQCLSVVMFIFIRHFF